MVSWETSCGVRIWAISTFSTNQKLSRVARSTRVIRCSRASLTGSITSNEGSTNDAASRTWCHAYDLSSWWSCTLSTTGWATEILSWSTHSNTLSVTNTDTSVVKSEAVTIHTYFTVITTYTSSTVRRTRFTGTSTQIITLVAMKATRNSTGITISISTSVTFSISVVSTMMAHTFL